MTQQDYTLRDTSFYPSNSIVFNAPSTKEIARFTEEGFYYKGEFVDDAGEVHRLLREVLNGITYKQLCIELLEWLDRYNNCCNTDIGIEEYGKSLSMADRARAALNP